MQLQPVQIMTNPPLHSYTPYTVQQVQQHPAAYAQPNSHSQQQQQPTPLMPSAPMSHGVTHGVPSPVPQPAVGVTAPPAPQVGGGVPSPVPLVSGLSSPGAALAPVLTPNSVVSTSSVMTDVSPANSEVSSPPASPSQTPLDSPQPAGPGTPLTPTPLSPVGGHSVPANAGVSPAAVEMTLSDLSSKTSVHLDSCDSEDDDEDRSGED